MSSTDGSIHQYRQDGRVATRYDRCPTAFLTMTDAMYAWLAKALKETVHILKREHASVVDRLRREQGDIRDRLKQAYLDNIDRKIDDALFARLSADYRTDEKKVALELKRRMDADLAYLDRGIELVGLAKDARRVFQDAGYEDRRRILTMLLSNCTYAGGKVAATFRKPFDFIAESLPRSVGAVAKVQICDKT